MTWTCTKDRTRPSKEVMQTFLGDVERIFPDIIKAWVIKENREWCLYLLTDKKKWSTLEFYRKLAEMENIPFELRNIHLTGSPWGAFTEKAAMVFDRGGS